LGPTSATPLRVFHDRGNDLYPLGHLAAQSGRADPPGPQWAVGTALCLSGARKSLPVLS